MKSTKRILTTLLALCLVLALMPGFAAPARAADELSYVALGDSVPYGYGLLNAGDSYVGLLADKLAEDGYAVTLKNAAISGLRSDTLLTGLQSANQATLAAIQNAGLITLNIGGNDVLGPIVADLVSKGIISSDGTLGSGGLAALATYTPSDELKAALTNAASDFAANFAAIITWINEKAPDAIVLVSTIYNPVPSSMAGLYSSAATLISAMNATISNLSATGNYAIADTYTAFKNSAASVTNVNPIAGTVDIHPNAAGHALMADIHYEVLAGLLRTGWDNPFTDVKDSDWFYGDVEFVNTNGLFGGTSANTFSPYVPMTRGMLVTVLWRMEGSPAVSGTPFTDVPSGQWYTEAVAWAAENGIANGVGGGMFAPDTSITREQVAVILLNYAKLKGTAPTGAWAVELDYADADKISDWAVEGAMFSQINGIISGRPGKLFDPQGTATRAEVAAILHRFAK